MAALPLAFRQGQQFVKTLNTITRGDNLEEMKGVDLHKHLARCFALLLFREQSNFLATIFPRNYMNTVIRFFEICIHFCAVKGRVVTKMNLV